MPTPAIPDWVQDAVFYQIFPDRFARSERVPKPSNLEPWDSPPTHHGFKGGDLLGVAERLDYLMDLGVNAIYFNPIFQSTANHRYHTHDYYQVDPILGGNAAFREMLAACHDRGIRVVLDGVFNHASRGFFQFNHILENEESSPYVDWFHVQGYPLNAYGRGPLNYTAWWNFPALPKLNTDTPAVREYLLGVAEHWIREGIDGWRLDVPTDIDDEAFWQAFRRRVKAVNPEAYLVGEIWGLAPDWLRGDRFDAVMNYVFGRVSLGFFGGEGLDRDLTYGPYRLEPLGACAFANRIDAMLAPYEWPVALAQLNILGSHDTPRLLTLFGGDVARIKLAIFYQMTVPGAPCIYYGDEIGLTGGPDPGCRKAMPWDETQWDASLHDHVRRCVALRHRHPALRRGDYTRLYAYRGVYAFGRRYEDETLVVVVNNDDHARQVGVPVRDVLPNGTVLRQVWPGTDETATVARGRLQGPRIPARSGMVWSAANAG